MIDPRQRALSLHLQGVAGHGARTEAKWLLEAAGDDTALLERMIARRLAGEPVDRIFGHRGFWTVELIVTPDTLSPRADTETIVVAARDHALRVHTQEARLRFLDLGTGTGAILLALLKEFPQSTGVGVDISEAALDVAKRNAALNTLAERATFQRGSWTTELAGTFDIIVSNPPYIPSGIIRTLDREVRDHDPHLALDGGDDGLACYRTILPQLPKHLAQNGFAVLEIGFGQADDVTALAIATGFTVQEIRPDFGGVPRAVVLTRA